MDEQIPYQNESEKKYALIEFVENPEPRCPYIILVDSSSSMGWASDEGIIPIDKLNEGLEVFKKELLRNELAAKRVELGVIAFDSEARNLTDGFVFPKNYEPTKIEAEGCTRMCDAIKLAYALTEGRKQQYKAAGVQYYRPWIVLLTDGTPTDSEGNPLEYDSQEFQEVVNLVHNGVVEKKFSFFAIGVGEDVDMEALSQICTPNRPPKKLSGMKFSELFKWLSDSATSRSSSTIGDKVALPATSGWDED